MNDLQAPWVGKSPEDWYEDCTGEKEFTFTFSMTGEITICAETEEDAFEKLKEYSYSGLSEFVETVDFE